MSRRASSCCSLVRSFWARVSIETRAGRYSFSKRLRFRSARPAPITGWASNGRFPHRRFSTSRRSSSGVAMARRGPTRIHTRPLARTGGFLEGSTTTTATGQPDTRAARTTIVGKGVTLPSSRIWASFFNSASSIGVFAQVPSSSMPTMKTPGFRWSGRSLANAQTASRILSRSEALLLHSTRSLSPTRSSSSSCSSLSTAVDSFAAFRSGCSPHFNPASGGVQDDMPSFP